MDKIKSIDEMCEVSFIFKCHVITMNQIHKNTSCLHYNEQDIIDYGERLKSAMQTIIDVYRWDMNREIDNESIEKEIEELKEKVIKYTIDALNIKTE